MIIDCHTHIWERDSEPGKDVESQVRQAVSGPLAGRNLRGLDPSLDQLLAASKPVDKSFVLAFKSRYLDIEIANKLVSQYVRQHPDRLIGFAGIDPTIGKAAIAEMRHARDELGLRGITLSPSAQNFHPADSRAMQVFAEAASLRLPVLIHQGVHFSMASKMEYARPYLLDEVAREFPTLKIVLAHLGYPWVDECVVLLGKHPNVFADISALLQRPWQAYQSLLAALDYGVIDKLLFGSDFPRMSATNCIEALYSINQVVQGTGLPAIPRQLLQAIVERDALPLLGLAPTPAQPTPRAQATIFPDHES